ncbi:hypothetical protein EON66_03885 [archaeon]|nr:MAG: hypothetical protein EON66_03885 [archaeon]
MCAQGKNAYYGNPKKKAIDRFSVIHFAGEVSYLVDGFIEKNNDTLYTDLEALMVSSSFPLVASTWCTHACGARKGWSTTLVRKQGMRTSLCVTPSCTHGVRARARADIFNDELLGDAHVDDDASTPKPPSAGAGAAAGGRQQSTSTIASKFKRQLAALNDTLLATTPHYVRWYVCVCACVCLLRVALQAGRMHHWARTRRTHLYARPFMLTLSLSAASSPTS